MHFKQILRNTEKFVIDNSPMLLTGFAVAGTITTAVLAGKASYRAHEVIEDAERRNNRQVKSTALTNRDKFELVWKLYIPAAGVGALTIAGIVGANRIGNRRAAAMAAAYKVSERAFEEYQAKVVEKLGEKKETLIRQEVAQDRVDVHQPPEQVIIAEGRQWCYDMMTDRYWESSAEDIKQAQNRFNHRMINQMGGASLNEWFDMVGLKGVPWGEEVGWNGTELLEVKFSPVMADNNRTALAVDFNVEPVRGYFRAHS
jgi:hypothetical protein